MKSFFYERCQSPCEIIISCLVGLEREREVGTFWCAMTPVAATSFVSLQIQPIFPIPQFSLSSSSSRLLNLNFLSLKPRFGPLTLVKSHQTHVSDPRTKPQDTGIPRDLVKTIVKFKSRHNYIRVLEVSRKADHPFAGSRLLLLDGPGNIHSISFLFKSLTNTYFDVFATHPPILPPGPLGILGFGAGSAARLILELYPQGVIHGYELDPDVIAVGREYFGLSKLEKEYSDRLFINIGNALNASVKNGFAGLLVDMFSKGCVIPELQDPETWERLKQRLRKGGRIMVNVGGSCVEAEDLNREGRVIMEETLKAMDKVFPGEVSVMSLGNGESCIAFTGELMPEDVTVWKKALPKSLKSYVDMWVPY